MGVLSDIQGRLLLPYLCVLLAIGPVYVLGLCVYRIWFHPLSRYPGPFTAKISNLYGGYHAWKGDLHIDMWRCHEKYGDYVRYAPNRLLVNTNTGLKEIYAFSKHFQKSQAYNAMVHRAPNTLTLIDKRAHGRKRRIISQGFSDSALREYEPTILTHIRKFCAQMSEEKAGLDRVNGVVIPSKWSVTQNMAKWSNYLTFDIMSDVIFGESYEMLEKPHNRNVIQCIEKSNVRTGVLLQAGEVATHRLDRYLFPDSILSRNIFIGFVNGLLKRRMSSKPLKRRDVFSFLLDAKDPETQQGLGMAEIGAESTTMIVAGSDTSSTAIASTFFYLSRYPQVYARVTQEVRSIFPHHSSVCLGPDLNSCIYLRACIDESLRMSPPAGSALWRQVGPSGATIDGHFIAPGMDVGTGIYSIHHNAAYYPEPFLYRPERWLHVSANPAEPKPAQLALAQSAFNPFSIGPRGCIGKGLAMTELMLTMAMVLCRFDFKAGMGSLACVGGGDKDAVWGRHREDEFQLVDHITAAKDGPIIQFCEREGGKEQ